ncbi:MAG: hypothetical protein LBN06_04020 [Prevotellaceae bacterium]|jgi:FtsZ-binding cell division protein ZapB|nr:hypothetical protein [Prevotellaceae bacterium]
MNFSFYIYGTPNGYNQCPADGNGTFLQECAIENSVESQLTILRKEQLVYYAYRRKLQEKSGNYLGFCLVFNGIYCTDTKKLFVLFDHVFDDVLMKGDFLRFEKGKAIFVINKFTEKPIELERIQNVFKRDLENNFNRSFSSIPISFKHDGGKKTVLVKDANESINSAIANFNCVHITNNEVTPSELERMNKMINRLDIEKQELERKYQKVFAQKKQYKIVTLLLLLLIMGGFIFYKVLSDKNKNIESQANDISTLHQANDALQNTINRQHGHIDSIQVLYKNMEGKYNTSLSNYATLENKYDTVRNELEEVKRKYESARQSQAEIEQKYEALCRENNNLEREYNLFKSSILSNYATLENKYDTVRNELEEVKRKYESARQSQAEIGRKYEALRRENNHLERDYNSFKNSIANVFPIIITDVQMANVDYEGNILTDYGKNIYSRNTMYLEPKIFYTGLVHKAITLNVKLFKPNGSLSTGNSSPPGYSFSRNSTFRTGKDSLTLSGWGGNDKGHWSKGNYRIEFWYGDICISSHKFTIY